MNENELWTLWEIFWKKSGKGSPISLLAPGARNPCYTTDSNYLICHGSLNVDTHRCQKVSSSNKCVPQLLTNLTY